MKPRFLILPLLVVLAGAAALSFQRGEIAATENRQPPPSGGRAVVRKSHNREPQRTRLERLADPASPLDWRRLALQFAELARYGETDHTRLHHFLSRRLEKMSPAEIAAAMDALSALDLAEDEVTPLLEILARDLSKRDPEMLLVRFPQFLGIGEYSGSISGSMLQAFAALIATDPTTAIVWLDQQIAAGEFVEKGLRGGSHWLHYERVTIGHLLKSGIDPVSRRLDQLPIPNRPHLFADRFKVPAGEESAFGEMVRGKISGEMQGKVVAGAALGRWELGGLSAVGEFLDAMNANDECRGEAAVVATSNELMRRLDTGAKLEDVDEFRAWAAGAAPEAVGAVTGYALGSFATDAESFAEAAARAEAYDVADGDDDALKMFLRIALPSYNREEAERRANAVTDPALREKILRRVR